MLKPIASMARSRPVLFAAVAGALFGLISTIVGEVGGALNKNPRSVLLLMLPAAQAGVRVTAPRAMQVAILLLVETTANVLVDALLFAAVVGLVVLGRRMLRRRKS
ncbi:MAG TPA: hypothetical protein VKR52_07810 [Terracidiphilus sp.]|nr:hypothetical protein [Terracidiphilus sp.]